MGDRLDFKTNEGPGVFEDRFDRLHDEGKMLHAEFGRFIDGQALSGKVDEPALLVMVRAAEDLDSAITDVYRARRALTAGARPSEKGMESFNRLVKMMGLVYAMSNIQPLVPSASSANVVDIKKAKKSSGA